MLLGPHIINKPIKRCLTTEQTCSSASLEKVVVSGPARPGRDGYHGCACANTHTHIHMHSGWVFVSFELVRAADQVHEVMDWQSGAGDVCGRGDPLARVAGCHARAPGRGWANAGFYNDAVGVSEPDAEDDHYRDHVSWGDGCVGDDGVGDQAASCSEAEGG